MSLSRRTLSRSAAPSSFSPSHRDVKSATSALLSASCLLERSNAARWHYSEVQTSRLWRTKMDLAIDLVITSHRRRKLSSSHCEGQRIPNTKGSNALTWVIALSSSHSSRSSRSSRKKYGLPPVDIHARVDPPRIKGSGATRMRSPLPPERGGSMMISSPSSPPSGSEGPASSACHVPELRGLRGCQE